MVTARVGPVLVSALLPLALLAGCGDGSAEPSGAAGGTESSSAAEPPSEPSSESSGPSSESPSASPAVPFPDVEPATGPVVEQPSIRFRGPTGWEPVPGMATNQSGAGKGFELLGLVEQDAMGGELSLDQDAEIALRAVAGEGDVVRLPDLEVDGQPMYRIGGPTQGTEWYEKVGTVRDGKLVTITFDLDRSATYGQDPRLVESVLNTVEWR